MPNWVFNELEVRGDNLQDFYNTHIVDGEFDFNTIIPQPADADRVWRINKWMSKWNASDTWADDLVENGCVSFQTPWSPPMPVIDALAKLYPEFEFEYKFVEEQGWGGTREYSDGREWISKSKDWDIPETHEDYVKVFDYCYACENSDEEEMEELGCPR